VRRAGGVSEPSELVEAPHACDFIGEPFRRPVEFALHQRRAGRNGVVARVTRGAERRSAHDHVLEGEAHLIAHGMDDLCADDVAPVGQR
jgi:hypothetical protein